MGASGAGVGFASCFPAVVEGVPRAPLLGQRRRSCVRLGLECPAPGPLLYCHVVIYNLNNRGGFAG